MGESIVKVYESCSSSLIMFLFQNADIQLEPLGSKTEQWGDQETLKCPSKVKSMQSSSTPVYTLYLMIY